MLEMYGRMHSEMSTMLIWVVELWVKFYGLIYMHISTLCLKMYVTFEINKKRIEHLKNLLNTIVFGILIKSHINETILDYVDSKVSWLFKSNLHLILLGPLR